MMEFCLSIGEDVNTLELAVMFYFVSSVLRWCFFIVIAITLAKYIKKENAPRPKNRSRKHHWRGR